LRAPQLDDVSLGEVLANSLVNAVTLVKIAKP
jgi:hypothetical protein